MYVLCPLFLTLLDFLLSAVVVAPSLLFNTEGAGAADGIESRAVISLFVVLRVLQLRILRVQQFVNVLDSSSAN